MVLLEILAVILAGAGLIAIPVAVIQRRVIAAMERRAESQRALIAAQEQSIRYFTRSAQ